MPDTIQNVPLPAGVWVDLYAQSGIAVGVAISVGNVGVADVYLAVQASQPPVNHDAYEVLQRRPSVPFRNSNGDTGAWALCPHGDGKVNVRVAV